MVAAHRIELCLLEYESSFVPDYTAIGWDGWGQTSAYESQSLGPYHLATSQCMAGT